MMTLHILMALDILNSLNSFTLLHILVTLQYIMTLHILMTFFALNYALLLLLTPNYPLNIFLFFDFLNLYFFWIEYVESFPE